MYNRWDSLKKDITKIYEELEREKCGKVCLSDIVSRIPGLSMESTCIDEELSLESLLSHAEEYLIHNEYGIQNKDECTTNYSQIIADCRGHQNNQLLSCVHTLAVLRDELNFLSEKITTIPKIIKENTRIVSDKVAYFENRLNHEIMNNLSQTRNYENSERKFLRLKKKMEYLQDQSAEGVDRIREDTKDTEEIITQLQVQLVQSRETNKKDDAKIKFLEELLYKQASENRLYISQLEETSYQVSYLKSQLKESEEERNALIQVINSQREDQKKAIDNYYTTQNTLHNKMEVKSPNNENLEENVVSYLKKVLEVVLRRAPQLLDKRHFIR